LPIYGTGMPPAEATRKRAVDEPDRIPDGRKSSRRA
jgi:hypothetical protein